MDAERIEKIGKQIAELALELTKVKVEQVEDEWPKVGDEYWYVTDHLLFPITAIYEGTYVDKSRKSLDIVFRTKEEACAEIHARLVIADLRKQPGRKKFAVGEKNWCIAVDLEDDNVFPDCFVILEMGRASTYFISEEAARSALQAVGEDSILKASRWLSSGEV